MNLGLLNKQQKPQDWIMGGFSPLTGGDLNPSGQWHKYLPVVEYQDRSFDRMACVSYSLLNTLEALHLRLTGIERNFSDRFLAKMSNTTHAGNYLDDVFSAARRFGLVDETVYPDVLTDWDNYYKDIPQEIKDTGLEFLSDWSIYREWIFPQDRVGIINGLRQTPLQVTVSYASGPGILYPTGRYNHAVMLYGYKEGEYWDIFDHYDNITKRYDWDYQFGVVLKPTLNNKYIPMKFKENYPYLLVEGPQQVLGMFLDDKMIIYDEKVDTLINSASRLKKYEAAIPVTLLDWNSVPHVDGRGNKLN